MKTSFVLLGALTVCTLSNVGCLGQEADGEFQDLDEEVVSATDALEAKNSSCYEGIQIFGRLTYSDGMVQIRDDLSGVYFVLDDLNDELRTRAEDYADEDYRMLVYGNRLPEYHISVEAMVDTWNAWPGVEILSAGAPHFRYDFYIDPGSSLSNIWLNEGNWLVEGEMTHRVTLWCSSHENWKTYKEEFRFGTSPLYLPATESNMEDFEVLTSRVQTLRYNTWDCFQPSARCELDRVHDHVVNQVQCENDSCEHVKLAPLSQAHVYARDWENHSSGRLVDKQFGLWLPQQTRTLSVDAVYHPGWLHWNSGGWIHNLSFKHPEKPPVAPID